MKKQLKFIVLGAVLGLSIVAAPSIKAGFFPVRPTFDYNKYSGNNDCNDTSNIARDGGRCGSLDGPVFNSFVNTPSYGDERSFTDGRRTDQSVGSNVDTVRNVTEGSKQVVIRMYVHNNANQNTNASGKGVATNARVKVELPTNADNALRAVGSISASNASTVYDTVDMTADRNFKVNYVPGSAKLLRNNVAYPLSNDIVTGAGALIGDDSQMDGNFKGCFDYAALVELTVNIVPEASSDLQVVKTVRKDGDTTWAKEVNAKPGDKVQWQIGTKNIGLDPLNNVAVRDVLPPHIKLVNGSVKMKDQYGVHDQNDGPVFSNGGIALGTYGSGGATYIIFTTTVEGDFAECSTRVRNVALARSTQTPEERDDADVVITKENCNPTTPQYSCDSFTATIGANRKTTFTTKASATNGATIKRYQYTFGDGSEVLITDKATVDYTYKNYGEYIASVAVDVEVNGVITTVKDPKCIAKVVFDNPSTPPSTPPTTTTVSSLPNTGAGAVLAIFAGVTGLSTLAYSVLARRFS